MDSIETLRKRYEQEANPDQPETVTGSEVGESSLDELRRKYNLSTSVNPTDDLQQIPGHETDRGSFVPDLGAVYKNQELDTIPEKDRRGAVGSALRESLRSEELLRKYGFNVPDIGQEDQSQGMLKYLKMPLAALKQLQRGQFATIGGLEGILEGDPSAAVRKFYHGLVFAEEHSTADLLERYHLLDNSPFTKFVATVAGDTIADPATWFSFGLGAINRAKVLKEGIKAAEHINPLLSDFGRATLKEAMKVVPEGAAVRSVIEEIRAGTKLGKKLVPSGVTFAHWVPKIGGQLPGDVFRFTQLAPGGVLQKIDDLGAAQETIDQLTDVVVSSRIVNWFGEAFVPYWNLRRKYPFLIELDRELAANNHEVASKMIQRGKEFLKSIPDEGDRKLITELLEKPELLTGRKLAVVNNVDPEVPEIKINTDYWPTQTKFTEENAREVVDFFLDAVKHLPEPGGALDITKLGVPSGMGAVYGGEKFEPMRAVLESVVAGNPTAKAYKLHFGDWVVKIPIPGGIRSNPLQPVNYASIQDAAGEIYSAQKLGDSGFVPETVVIWKKVKELVQGSETGGVPVSFENMNSTRYGKPIAWAQVVGGWEEYKRLVPEAQRQFKDITEYANSFKGKIIKSDDLLLPVLVKRFVKGETVDSWFKRTVQDYVQRNVNKTGYSGQGAELAKRYQAIINMAKGIARTGISVHDAHAQNVMFNEASTAIWIDNARFVDHVRGLDSTGVGRFPDFAGTLGSPESVTAHGVESKVWNPEQIKAFGRYEKTKVPGLPEVYPAPFPGAPAFDVLYPTIEAAGAHASEYAALREAYVDALNLSMGNLRGLTNMQNQRILRPLGQIHELASLLPKEEKLKFVEALKEAGIVENYSFTGNKLSAKFTDAEKMAFEPIEKILQAGKPQREWEEQVETIVAKHPALLNASPERQDHILKMYNMGRAWKDEIENTLLGRGMIDKGRMDAFKEKFGLNHIPHIKDADNPLQLFNMLNKALKNREKIGALKARDIEGTIAAINKEFGTQFFEDDIAVVLTKHAIDVGLAANARKFIEDAAKLFGKPAGVVNIKNVSGRTVARSVADAGWTLIDHPALEGIQLPSEVAEVITKYTRTFNNPDAAGKAFWKYYSKVLDQWKGYATFVNPGFHGRNFFSNLFQLYLKNGPEAFWPGHHQDAINVLRSGTGSFTSQSGRVWTHAEVLELAKKYGVYGTGWFGSDIRSAENVKALLKGAQNVPSQGFNPLSQGNLAFQAGRFVGGSVENEARMVGFIMDLKRTDNPLWAATNTKKFMFDYSELTAFDKQIKTFVFPFWAWMKKNIALQAEQIIKQPAKYGNIERIRQAMKRASPNVDERWLPNYFPEIYASETPFKTKEGHVLYVNPNLPFQDINKLFDPKDWISSLAPWKTVFELAANKSLFNMRDIQKYRGEVVNTPWLDLIPSDMMTKIGPLIGATKAYDPEQKKWYWGLNPKVKYAIEQANPFFRNFGKTAQTLTGQSPEYNKEKAPYDVMSWMTGVKLIPYNPSKEMEGVILRRRDYLRDQKKAAVMQGKLPSKYLPPTH